MDIKKDSNNIEKESENIGIKELSAGYHDHIVIGNISLDIKRGEIVSLIGPNGGGKSTVLKTISGELKPLGGAVIIGQDDIKNISLRQLSKTMSIVNTTRVNPEHMSVLDVVLSGRLPYSDFGLFKKEDMDEARRACDLMNIDKLSHKPFSSLSDGQKQRTLIARAICQDPRILIMDEPTSYLDIRHRFELMDVIRKLSKNKVTIIMSLHELDLALEISDKVLLIRDDGTCSYESPKEVIDKGQLKELFGLSDDMYEKVRRQLMSVH